MCAAAGCATPTSPPFDIHDRVNYSVQESNLTIDPTRTQIQLGLRIDTRYGSVMDYFEIF